MNSSKAVFQFILALSLALASLALVLVFLAYDGEQVYAAAPRSSTHPVDGRPGPRLSERLEPPRDGAHAPHNTRPLAPLYNGAGAASVITVCELSAVCPYTIVQKAVNDAPPGSVIKVAQGLYDDVHTLDGHQQVVYITKSLTLQGGYTVTNWMISDPDGNPTVLDAGGQSDTRVVYIAAGVAPTIEGFRIRGGNMPGGAGAGVYISGGEPEVRRNRIYQNQAEFGSGVYILEGSPLLENCLIYSNTADKGAGVYVKDGSPAIQFNTLHGNEATQEGGGVYVAPDGMPSILASIIASNTARTDPVGGGGIFSLGDEDFIEVQYNDVVGNVGEDYVGIASGGNIEKPPGFVDPSASDFRLRAESGCIGIDALNYPTEGPADDFDNYGRPFGQFPDIGAHEYHAPSACYTRVDSGRVYTTVQEAVDRSDAEGLVRVSGWCTGTGDSVIQVDRDLTLSGGYTKNDWQNADAADRRTTLDGEGARRVIYVDQYVDATVEGFDICNGWIGVGGGIYLDTGSDSIIRDNRIYSNTVFYGGGTGYGGGIYVRSSGPMVRDNQIYSNTAARLGGGVYIDEVRDGDVVIESNTIRANKSAEGGGGIGVDDSRQDGDVVIRHNEIYTNVNSTSQGGGGILCYNGSCVIQYNAVYSNTALSKAGGGIRNSGSSTIEFNRIYGNVAEEGGGGIYSEGVMVARYNVISGNVASSINGQGGGINAYGLRAGENLRVESNRIYGNTSGKYGGGVALSYAWPAEPVTVTARNNLIFANTAPRGAGCSIRGEFVYVENNTIYGNIGHGIDEEDLKSTGVIRANIIVSNTGYGISMFEGNFSSVYNDVWGNNSGGIQCEDSDHCASASGNISADPRFEDPAELESGLQSDSPCRDAVLTTTHAAYDYNHYARPFGAYADMGAHELYVGSCFATLSTGVGIGGRVYTTVQAAVLTATDAVDDVLVAGVCEGADAMVTIDKSLALRGGYTKSNWTEPTVPTVLDAKGQNRVVTITGASDLTVTVGELIIRGASEAGIYVATSLSPTIRNVMAYDNGDAFTLAAGGSPRLYNNTFVSNTGDGIDLSGSGSPVISNTIVVGNAGNGINGTVAVLAYNDVWNNGVDYQGLSPGTTDISVAPAFKDPASGDFHLSFDSPCLHAGDPNTGLTWDLEGDLRPDNTGQGQRYDIGADEASDYLGVDIGPTIYRLTAPGDLIQYTHYLTNSGTRDGSFSISSTLEVNMGSPGDWVYAYDPDHALLAGEATAVPVNIEAPSASISGTLATLFLTATYQSGGIDFFDVTSSTIRVQSDWGFTLSTLEDQIVDPGQVYTYAHMLKNLGSPDTFTLTVSSSLGWAEVVPADQVGELGSGQSAPVYVIVSLPITASSDAVERTVVVATSHGAASGGELLQRTITDTTYVKHIYGDRYVAVAGSDNGGYNSCLISTSPCGTIRQAIKQASGGEVIRVSEGEYREFNVALNEAVKLEGGYSEDDWDVRDPESYVTTINAQGAGRVLYVGGSPVVEGFTLRNGDVNGFGGGVYIAQGADPTFRLNVITGNRARSSGGVPGRGGGIYNAGGDPTLERNIVMGNTADEFGGGIYNRGGDPNIWNNLVYDNDGSDYGGGFYNYSGSPLGWFNTFVRNSADRGGGLYLHGGSPSVSDTIVFSNTASTQGGGIYINAAGAVVDYNAIGGNTPDQYAGLSVGSHITSASPLFVNAATDDFHLRKASPLRDIGDGVDPGVLNEDYDGQPRTMNSIPDIGADEYQKADVALLSLDAVQIGDESDLLTYTHILTNTGNYLDEFLVTWESDLSSGWTITVNGSTEQPVLIPELSEFATTTVEVLIQVPADVLSGTINQTTITATSVLDPEVADDAKNTTLVGRSVGVSLEPSIDGWADPTFSVVYTHTLSNEGNFTDTFDLEISPDVDNFANSIVSPSSPVVLDKEESVDVVVRVDVKSLASEAEAHATLVTATSGTKAGVSAVVTDTTVAKRRLGMELASDSADSALTGSWVYYEHVLTNTGNYTDTYLFTVVSALGWQVTVNDKEPPVLVEVGAWPVYPSNPGARTVDVGVYIPMPPTAFGGDVETTVITAKSQANGESKSVTDVTTALQQEGVELWPNHSNLKYVDQSETELEKFLRRVLATGSSQVVTFTHNLYNNSTSNSTDTYALSWSVTPTWQIAVDPTSTGEVAWHETITDVVVTLTVPMQPEQPGQAPVAMIFVTATSGFNPTGPYGRATVTDTVIVNQRVEAAWSLGSTRLAQYDSAGEDGTAVYAHTLTNAGNYTDSFTLEFWSGWGRGVQFEGVDGNGQTPDIGAGQTHVITVEVTVPYAQCGLTGDVIITATSRTPGPDGTSNYTPTASVVDSIRIGETYYAALSPALERRYVSTTTTEIDKVYTRWVANTGNCTNRFSLGAQGSFTPTVLPLVTDWLSSVLDSGVSSQLVAITVTVPRTDPANLVTGSVEITASGEMGGFSIVTDTIIINQQVQAALGPDGTDTISEAGSVDILYTHTLTNEGNYDDAFELDWWNEDGWTVELKVPPNDSFESQPPVQSALLAPGGTAQIDVRVRVPPSVYTVTNRTWITATSLTPSDVEEVAVYSPTATTVDTTLVQRPHVTIGPDFTGDVAPGASHIYTNILTNTGGLMDSYTITCVSLLLGWLDDCGPVTVQDVSPGETREITVAVTVAQAAEPGDYDEVVITATSWMSYTPIVYDIAVDTTNVLYILDAELSPEDPYTVEPGTTVTFTHQLTNTGNYTESFTLATGQEFSDVDVNPSEIEDLPPGQSTSVEVTVAIPRFAPGGAAEQVDVNVFGFHQVLRQTTNVETIVDIVNISPTVGTRFVAPNGSDENNNCTMRDDKEPCRTVQHGVDQSVDGDTVKVTSGTYVDVLDADQVVRVGKSITVTGGYTISDWIVSHPDIRPTILDAEDERRVMVIEANITPTIEGFHLRQGSIDGDNGAGLYIAEDSVPTLRVNRIYNNTATQSGTEGGKGGGIYYGGGATPIFERNAIYDNFARRGGGVYLESGDARLWSNLIYANDADLGGGLYNSSGAPVVWNNTFHGNTAGVSGGGGIFADSGTPVISSTIVVNNQGYGIVDGGTAEFTLAYNNVWNNTPGGYSPAGIPHDDDISENPLFLDVSNDELRLTFRSPCIDAGDLDVATPPDEDYEGNPRVLFGRRDIGAYEYGITGIKTVTPTAQTDTIVTYTVQVVNIGTAAHTIVVTDVLNEFLDPTGVLAYSFGDGGYVTPTRSITWTGLVPGNGTVATITFTARITDGVANYTPIPNVAWIDHGAADTVTTTVVPRVGTRYVAKKGDDSDNDCRLAPCLTIQYAVDQAQPGDEVRVAGDAAAYADGVITVSKQITLSGGFAPPNWVAFDPSTRETTLQAPGFGQPGVVISGSVVRLAGFHITGGADGVRVINGGDLTLYRSWVHDNTDGVRVEDGSSTLINSVVAQNTSVGLRSIAGDSVLVHNTFANNDEGGAIIGGVAHITNTLFSTNTVGISVTGSAELWNTLWWGGDDVYTTGATIIEHSSIISEPLFVDVESIDYHILEDSGAVDQGTLIDDIVVKEDFDGEARVVRDGPDIGADEFPLGLTKTGPSAAEPGQMITYTIELNAVDVDLVITDVLPIYLTYASPANTYTCTVPTCSVSEVDQTLIWTGDSTDVVYITYTGHLAPWLGKGEIITNSALLERQGRVGESMAWVTVISQVHGTRYVAPTGVNEEPDGTDNNCLMEGKPCRTVQWAVNQAMDGDTVKVAAGTYTSTASSVVRIDKPVTLVGGCSDAVPGWPCDPEMYETKLDAQASASDRRRAIEIAGTSGPVTVDGFHLLNGYVNNSGGGIRASGATVVLVRDQIYDNAAAGSNGGGIYLVNADITIVDSRIYTNTTTGIGAGMFAWETDFDLTNNVFADNVASGGGDGIFVDGQSGSYGEMRHNTIADNGDVGVWVNDKFSVVMTNTILSDHAVAGIEATGDAVVTVDHTLLRATDTLATGDGSVVVTATLRGDPRFMDPSGWDYHIRPGSAAFDAGVEAGVTVDIDGDLRPMGRAPDVGADELRVELSVSKEVEPSVAVAGVPLTYTIRLTNTGQLTLTTTITDLLPAGVEPGPLTRTWSLPAFAPGEPWQTEIVVTAGFSGTLVNEVQVSTTEGATGSDVVTSVVTGEPIIDVTPPSLSATLPATGTITLTLTIRNQGNVDLNWSLRESVDVDWLDESPTSGVVAPSSSTGVSVGFDANGLEEGRSYTTALLIDSDDPNTPQVSVDVRLTVGTVDHVIFLPLVLRNH